MNDRPSLWDGDRQQTDPCRTKSKAQASSTEEEVTSSVSKEKRTNQWLPWSITGIGCGPYLLYN